MGSQVSRAVVRYTGHVQGVGFRMTAIAQADQLRINGFVRNEPGGTVLMDVEGTAIDIKELMRRIEFQMGDKIDGTQIDRPVPMGHQPGFRIRY